MGVTIRYFLCFWLLSLPMVGGWAQQTAGDDLKREYDVLFLEAMLQRQKGNDDACFDLLLRCHEMMPDASETNYFLGIYYSMLKQDDKSLNCFKRAVDLEPDNAVYLETLSQSYTAANRFADAIGVVEHLYDSNKDRQDLLERLYGLYLKDKNFAKAIETLDRMELIDGKSERLSLAKCGLYFQTDEQQKAIDEMEALARKYPNDPYYRSLLASTLMVSGQNDRAYTILKEVLAEEPDNAHAQMAMRNNLLAREDTLAADSLMRQMLFNKNTPTEDKIQLLRQAISYNESNGGDSTVILNLFRETLALPDPDPDVASLCVAYMNLKEMPADSTRQVLEFLLRLQPDNAAARLQLVQQAWQNDDDARIIELCKQARQYNPDEMAFYYYQGIAYYRRDDTDNALEAFQNGISVITEESNPAIVSDFYAVMGDLLHQKGRIAECYASYDSCLQWKPDNYGCLNNYAYFLSEEGIDLDRAEQMSYKAVKAEPKNATYLDTYAWILFKQKRYTEARIYMDQVMKYDEEPGSVVIEHAGDVSIMLGETDTALSYWRRALELDPTNKRLAKKIKKKKYVK